MNLFSTRDEAEHRDQKKAVAAAYSMSSLLEMEGAVDSCSDLLMKRLDDFATAGKAFDLGVSVYVMFLLVLYRALRLLIGLASILCLRRRRRAHLQRKARFPRKGP